MKRTQVTLRLPLPMISTIQEIAKLAGVNRTQVINVIMAMEVVRNRPRKQP